MYCINSISEKIADSYVRLSTQQTARWNIILQLMREETALTQKGIEKVLRSCLNILLFDLAGNFRKLHLLKKRTARMKKIYSLKSCWRNILYLNRNLLSTPVNCI